MAEGLGLETRAGGERGQPTHSRPPTPSGPGRREEVGGRVDDAGASAVGARGSGDFGERQSREMESELSPKTPDPGTQEPSSTCGAGCSGPEQPTFVAPALEGRSSRRRA
jgi:hypothetical protein